MSMKLIERRREADKAFAAVRHREHVWASTTRSVRTWSTRHRAAVIVGSGFTAGLATSLLPIAAIMRLASAFAGAASLMLEGPFLRLLAAQRQDASVASAPPSTTAL
jgi:predicted phage tail protein